MAGPRNVCGSGRRRHRRRHDQREKRDQGPPVLVRQRGRWGFRRKQLYLHSRPMDVVHDALLSVFFVRRKKKRCDESAQISKRAQGDPGHIANLEKASVRPGHPRRKVHGGPVGMPNDQHGLSACPSASKACDRTPRQRMKPVVNRHLVMKTGSV